MAKFYFKVNIAFILFLFVLPTINAEKVVLNVYPANENALILIDVDKLKAFDDFNINSINVIDKYQQKLKSDFIKINEKNHLAIINKRGNDIIFINNKLNKAVDSELNPTLNLKDNENVKIVFEKKGFSIESFEIGDKMFDGLQFVSYSGEISEQSKDFKDVSYSIDVDSPIVKVISLKGKLKCKGSLAREGWLPVEIRYTFWSSNSENIFADVEIKLFYEEAVDFDGRKLEYMDPFLWFGIDNILPVNYNEYYTNFMDKDNKVVTLKRPYYAYIDSDGSIFAMFPYLALPNDGIHIEVTDRWFGAAWHSLSKAKKPYWIDERIGTNGQAQGYFPAHSLNSYWKIGLFFGNGNVEDIAKIFTYKTKIRYIEQENGDIGNAYITHWYNNSIMAFNAIDDDARFMDYPLREKGIVPWWVQIAIPVGMKELPNFNKRYRFGSSYYYCCYDTNNQCSFFSEKFQSLSIILNTLLVKTGLCNGYYVPGNASFILHTYSHPEIWKSSAEEIKEEIRKSEDRWIKKGFDRPLSHVFSYYSPYDIPLKEGTRESIAFSNSPTLQWIREYDMPNAPTDFFLPSKLYWSSTVKGDFYDKGTSEEVIKVFNEIYEEGGDYMLISGHVPDKPSELPLHIKKMFMEIENKEDVWFTSADEIIKYYKARENVEIGDVYKEGNYYFINVNNSLPDFYNIDLTLTQRSYKEIKKIEYTFDGTSWTEAKYRKESNTYFFDIPFNAVKIREK